CWENLNGTKSDILKELKKCGDICWSKHDFGKDTISDDCYTVTIFSTDQNIGKEDIESLEKFFVSYIETLNSKKPYNIKIRYESNTKKISFTNIGYCGNGIIEGIEFCDQDSSVCKGNYIFGECTGSHICKDCICTANLECSLCQPPTKENPSIEVDWCKYCRSSSELNCFDNIDNDCDGKIDKDDSDCIISKPQNSLCAKSIDEFLKNRVPRLYGIGDCIVDVNQKTQIPITVLISIPIAEGGWNIDNKLQNGFCNPQLGNPPNKLSNNLYSIKGNGCFWRTFECYDTKKYDVDCSQQSYNCCINPPTTECGNSKYKCYIISGFRAYETKCDSINDFANLVMKSYQNTMKYTNEPDQFVRELQKGGYASSPLWADQVINIMNIVKSNLNCDNNI
ncbi:MAG: glucosaminidase domain-containing protein, partial [Candidatus Aenigmarchaeota archaeon]|nr:glucosaminidase domain-containing protein [Candidatus Aenigmarchaeota archaeon]